MLELDVSAQRGNFQLQLACRFTAPLTVLFGPSGSGKSTLLRIVAGLETDAHARIVFDGRPLSDSANRTYTPPGQRGVGFVAQRPALFPHLGVEANVAYGVNYLGPEIRQQRVTEMLELTGAAHLAHRSPRSLSGGEAQRIAVARALAPMPRLLLLDEPFSGLDAAARDQLFGRLQSWLAEQKMHTILVTHDGADALASDAEVAVLDLGRLTAQGPAAQVLAAERIRLLAHLNRQNPLA
jgi:ABC-type sulfate/molybdate transport systems ATPase subunit